MDFEKDAKGNEIVPEIWTTVEHTTWGPHFSPPSLKPWDDDYDAPITQWASNVRYVHGALHDAEIARLRMALAESEAAVEGALMVLMQTQAERDAALAQVAGAYEAAAILPTTPEWRWRFEPHWSASDMAAAISALTPADALEALSRRDAQMRAEGMQMAAEMARGRLINELYVEWPWRGEGNRSRESELGIFARDLTEAILAAAKKEVSS